MQDSVECAGPQKHNGESPMFIHCMILEIQLFLPIPSSKASCCAEASHLVEEVQNNGCISKTIQQLVLGLRVPLGHLHGPRTSLVPRLFEGRDWVRG